MICSYLIKLLSYCNAVEGTRIRIVAHVRNRQKAEKLFPYTNGEVEIADFDISCPISYEPVDYVIHGASLAGMQCFRDTPADVMLPNTIGMKNLLDWVTKVHAKLLFMSSYTVYGMGDKPVKLDETMPVSVDYNSPNCCYTGSKIAGELLCLSYNKQFGTKTVISRIAHTYSPTADYMHDTRIISKLLKGFLIDKRVEIYEDDSLTQFTHVGDICTAMLFELTEDNELAEAYNTCGEHLISVKDVAQLMISEQKSGEYELISKPQDEKYLFKKKMETVVDNGKLKSLRGWKEMIEYGYGIPNLMRILS